MEDGKTYEPHKAMILSVGPDHFVEKKGKTPEIKKIQMGVKLDEKYRATEEDLKQARTIRVRKETM